MYRHQYVYFASVEIFSLDKSHKNINNIVRCMNEEQKAAHE